MSFSRQVKKPSYVIMTFIGVFDTAMLLIVVLPDDIMSITGDVFCSSPSWSYVTGSLAMGRSDTKTDYCGTKASIRSGLELYRFFSRVLVVYGDTGDALQLLAKVSMLYVRSQCAPSQLQGLHGFRT